MTHRANINIVLVTAALLLGIPSTHALAQPYGGGSGTSEYPYLISEPNHMQAIGANPDDWDKHFKLTTDIDMTGFSGERFNIIGNSDIAFTGVFDGNNKTIQNFTYDSNDGGAVGVFGVIDSDQAIIQNLILNNPTISNVSNSGGLLVGSLNSGQVINCKVTGGSISGYNFLGGLVGYASTGAEIKNCNVACTVTGQSNLGGIVGKNNGRITKCHFDGNVSGRLDIGGITGMNVEYIEMCSSSGVITIVYDPGSNYYAGGIAGGNSGGTIRYSHSSAYVTGSEWMGGLVGNNYQSTIEECYATGNVSGSNRLGGLVGSNSSGVVRNCYATGNISGNAAIGGLIGDNSVYNSSHVVEHCYSIGHVSGSYNVGGLIGYDYDSRGNFQKCFWNQTANPTLDGIGNSTDPDVIGETTINMKLRSTYESVGWNFVTPIWIIEDGLDYPDLWWEVLSNGYGGGTGQPNDPYLIYTPEQLNTIGRDFSNLDKHFKLMADINLVQYSGEQFNMIGDQTHPFTGVFDGNGHSIINFNYSTTQTSDVGLFGYIGDEKSEIKNLTLIEPHVILTIPDPFSGWGYGAIAGKCYGQIKNCHVIGGTVHGAYNVGGLMGSGADIYDSTSSCNVSGKARIGCLAGSTGGTISRCHATGTVSGDADIGGLLGSSYAELISECWADCIISGLGGLGGLIGENNGSVVNSFAHGNVSGSSSYIGGFVGENKDDIRNCYSGAVVSGDDYVGGFCGKNDDGVIENSYSTGLVTATGDRAGGFVGICGVSYYCFWDVDNSGIGTSGDDNCGATGKTTEQMKSLQTFLSWGCDPVWTIQEGIDYPHLIWENEPGEVISKPTYGGGSGDPNDPYLIYTPEQLNTIGLFICDLGRHFKLMADINLSCYTGTQFNCIGTAIDPFVGVFDGNGHTIRNLTYYRPYTGSNLSYNNKGLFGTVYEPDAQIRDLILADPNIDAVGAKYVGSLVGSLGQGKVIRCSVEGGIVKASSYVGGLIGNSTGASIEDSHSSVSVSGGGYIGGLVGRGDNIYRSYALGDTTGSLFNIGGLVGWGSNIIDCHSEGNVSGRENVGGLVGYGNAISNCHAGGDVTGAEYVGGLVGKSYNNISDSYALGNVTGSVEYVGGLAGSSTGISNCYALGNVVSSGDRVGGLVGKSKDISNSYSGGNVSGKLYVGGLAGFSEGTVYCCFAAGTVSGIENVGGLAGYSQSSNTHNCYAIGNVDGSSKIGGLVGYNYGSSEIHNCYSIGIVTGTTNVGGLTGDNVGAVWSSFWDTETSGQINSSSGRGKTTAQMQTSSTFLGWGCDGVWTIDEGNDYPRLLWENAPGDLINIQLTDFITGVGTHDQPYLIFTHDELNLIGLFSCEWDKHYLLKEDLDLSSLSGMEFNIIGRSTGYPFSGVFNSDDHTISNFAYSGTRQGTVGIFGYIDGPNAQIRDLVLIDPNITTKASNIGSLVGKLSQGIIVNCGSEHVKVSGNTSVGGLIGGSSGSLIRCYVNGEVSGNYQVGGLVAYNSGIIFQCQASVTVTGGSYTGGLAGYSSGDDSISDSFSRGVISGSEEVGGIVGYNRGDITNCYTTADVHGIENIGGLVGYNMDRTISNSYSIGRVSSAGTYVGGLVGRLRHGTVSNSFWDVASSGCETSFGGTGLITAQMQDPNTFLDAGWDFVGEEINGTDDIWDICVGMNYPKLVWRIPQGDFVCPDGVLIEDLLFFADSWMLSSNDSQWHPICDISDPNDNVINLVDFSVFSANWLAGLGETLSIQFDLDDTWMYQNLPDANTSNSTATVSIANDPYNNTSYTYNWEFILPDDVTIAPTVKEGGNGNAFCTFTAPGSNEPAGLSDSGQLFAIKVTVKGNDYGNIGIAEAEFGIALLGDVSNDTVVNIADCAIVNAFWRTGLAGGYTLSDCDLNCDGTVNITDRVIANAIWRGQLGQNSVINPCPLRYTPNQLPSDMVFIPGGEFEMGDHFAEGEPEELPVHSVLVDSFFMSKFEITNQQYREYLNSPYRDQIKSVNGVIHDSSDTGNSFPYCDTLESNTESQIYHSPRGFYVRTKGGRDMSDDPMVRVTWYGAAAYCNWRSRSEGYEECYDFSIWECDSSKHGYRLPTEAEWEYAARGGLSGKRFTWADPNISHTQANYTAYPAVYSYDESLTVGCHPDWDDGIYPFTAPVGSFSANGYGMYDMSGNIYEWCNDWYDENYYDISPYDNPQGASSGTGRVLRGGGWGGSANHCRVAIRDDSSLGNRDSGVGFRIVLDLN